MLRIILIPVFLIGIASLALAFYRRSPAPCLPQGISMTDVVSVDMKRPMKFRKPGEQIKKITVEQKLKELGARCRKGKLVDARGREVRFYHLQGCWGNPPPDYLEILERQRKELETLKKSYTVIEMTCNTSGEMPM